MRTRRTPDRPHSWPLLAELLGTAAILLLGLWGMHHHGAIPLGPAPGAAAASDTVAASDPAAGANAARSAASGVDRVGTPGQMAPAGLPSPDPSAAQASLGTAPLILAVGCVLGVILTLVRVIPRWAYAHQLALRVSASDAARVSGSRAPAPPGRSRVLLHSISRT